MCSRRPSRRACSCWRAPAIPGEHRRQDRRRAANDEQGLPGHARAAERPDAALYLNHVLDDMPVETDVFTSLSYFLPLFVLAGGEAWEVDGTRIRQMGVTFDWPSDQPHERAQRRRAAQGASPVVVVLSRQRARSKLPFGGR